MTNRNLFSSGYSLSELINRYKLFVGTEVNFLDVVQINRKLITGKNEGKLFLLFRINPFTPRPSMVR